MNININIKLERPSMEEIEVNIIENDIIFLFNINKHGCNLNIN